MSRKKGFPDNIKRDMAEVYNGYCCVEGCLEKIHSFHHKLPQIVYYRKKFPLFIDSVFNCSPVGEYHHKHCRQYSELNISEDEAEVYEGYLEKLKREK